jgi:chemotaxis protein MotB
MKTTQAFSSSIVRTLLLSLALGTTACGGYSEEEMQAQLDKYAALADQHQKTEAELAEARARAAKLADELEAMGFKLNEEGAEKGKLMAALQEYKARAAALERIKARFESLRKKLDELTKLGLQIDIRNNRMVISLPGDVLFASGKDTLEKEGVEILGKVATVIRDDQDLAKRTYQVAGHTDNQPIASLATKRQFKDNWGLSLMRAREVLLFLVTDMNEEKNPGGGLDSSLWSASGYGETDPIAANDTPEGRMKNRRVELIMMPNVEEMLDLKSLASEPVADVEPPVRDEKKSS